MPSPVIAVIGSVTEGRVYEKSGPAITKQQSDAAQQAARLLGNELALRGYRLMVYSGEPEFIERYVVEGYVASGKATERSIEVVYPQDRSAKATAFPARVDRPELFALRPDRENAWQVSFYRSLGAVNGIVMIGGGEAARAVGLLALAYRIPLLALGGFGGRSREIWNLMLAERDLPSKDAIDAMGEESATPDLAKRWAQSLDEQLRRRETEIADAAGVSAQRSQQWLRRRAARAAVAITFVWVALLLVGLMNVRDDWEGASWLGSVAGKTVLVSLFVLPLISGALGSTVAALLGRTEFGLPAGVLGALAGLVVALLSLIDKVFTSPPPSRATLVFAAIYALLAGLTADAVWQQLVRKPLPIDSPAERGTGQILGREPS